MRKEIDDYILNKYGVTGLAGYHNGSMLLNDVKLNEIIREYYRKTPTKGQRIFNIPITTNLSKEAVDELIINITNKFKQSI